MQHVKMCEVLVERLFLLLSWKKKRTKTPPKQTILILFCVLLEKNTMMGHEEVDSSSVRAHLLYNARNTGNTTER